MLVDNSFLEYEMVKDKTEKRKECTMMNNEIYVLPHFEDDLLSGEISDEEFIEHIKVRKEAAKTTQYVPDSLETLKAIEYMDKKYLMFLNEHFRAAALALCHNEIKKLIERDQSICKYLTTKSKRGREICERIQNAVTIDDLIRSGYYGDNYDTALREILSVLVEDYLTVEEEI